MGIYHSNIYAAANACNICEGIIRHESWCMKANRRVLYAYAVTADPKILTSLDKLILHALGVKY
jgi:hypothetical protein